MIKSKFTRLLIGTFALTSTILQVSAKEGMWLPPKIKAQEAEMKKLGLQIPVEELYNEDGLGLNNAVVHFGGGCTGEFVSANGLIFTNHHCAYSYGQALSTTDHNYLENGFFAQNLEQELPCPGLNVKIVKKIENVTPYILKGIDSSTTEENRKKIIEENTKNLTNAYEKLYNAEVEIKAYYEGNEYWAAIRETYNDVRLVIFPPNGIGKFGADTDNWMWPRQSGDFAVLRVYADANNNPADYNKNNKPFKPVKYFPINISGVKEGDFTMVYGFPGRTTQYLSSQQVAQVQNIVDPIRIDARTIKLNIWDKYMRQDKSTFLKYASKQASVANGWKKWQGEVLGLTENNVVGKKQKIESQFQQDVANSENTDERTLLTLIDANVNGSNDYVKAQELQRECILGIEAVQNGAVLNQVLNVFRAGLTNIELTDTLTKIKNRLNGFYKNYEPSIDKEVFEGLMTYYLNQNINLTSKELRYLYTVYGNDIKRWSKTAYNNSLVTSKDRLFDFLSNATAADSFAIIGDPIYKIYYESNKFFNSEIAPKLKTNINNLEVLNRKFVAAQLKYNPARKALYPDANSTLRIAYGNVKPIAQKEGNFYLTTLDMKMPRHNENVDEFNIPEKLRKLYEAKDFGRWTVNGTVPINFIATNHTTGGNSGSPVLNAKGELIGINFDRIWQGTMSDIYFHEDFCRNIAVDVRYVLFIIEKYGNAKWLLNEMKLVK
jgi:hypothetical protein